MWGVEFADGSSFVYSIFGFQHHEAAEPSLPAQLDALIEGKATCIDRVTQDGPKNLKTTIWIAYWSDKQAYTSWWTSLHVSEFWNSLPPNAGMWREVMFVPGSRTQFGTNKETINGMASVATLVPNDDKSGYWGCYRDRIREATPQERLATPLTDSPVKKDVESTRVRTGRTKMTSLPDNLCFVVEGQDHSVISAEEKALWFDNFDGLVAAWIGDLVDAGPAAGILDARLCYSEPSGTYRASEPAALNFNRKIQLFYFLDMRSMEKIGRANKGHVKLRGSFMEAYCPTGPMGGSKGELILWVETSVMKGDEMEAEYVGCVEGTGWMAYEGNPSFQASVSDSAKL